MSATLYQKNVELLGEYEVCVLGGGPSGVAAARTECASACRRGDSRLK